jgi:hypothetical protein
MLQTDYTVGPYAGRVYVTAETSLPGSREIEDMQMRRRVVLFRSTDDGRSFIGPVEVARGNNTGMAAYNLLVFSDGTLFIPVSEYPNYGIDKASSVWKIRFATSSDGGVTVSTPQPITEIRFGGVETLRRMQKSGRVDQIGGPVFAMDSSNGKFRDRLYAAWNEMDNDRFRLMLTSSADRGKTWTAPKPVDSGAPAYASQFQPMIAVNSDGVLGISFYSTEGYPSRDKFDVYFAASNDGGETLQPKKRVSSEASQPFGSGNLRPGPMVRNERGMVTVFFVSALSRWVNGGDYIGLTADSEGTFHPFWADGRTGTYQLYTAPIRVESGPAAKSAPVERVAASLTERVSLIFDPIRYDAATSEVLIPVRFKNVSSDVLYPPFRVEIKELVHPYSVKAKLERSVPTILNAANGKNAEGAVFDYANVLGDLDRLAPNAVSNAVVWRLKAASPVKTDFYIGAEITGFVDKKKEDKVN